LLLTNRAPWTDFLLVRCDSRHDGHVVLLGDAAHTAHFSIGSGEARDGGCDRALAGVRAPSG
jgi:2-polyprenyl-6-methoxyphenol hydroxylase-like FAD-dependent oxidoreductase